ncbi:MFS transporter [Gryllotalpicola koreensis]|uniref:Major facilitator superfamily (MFS) profile domain-containing protein n=1 Tax=Gryllotalpicola koreensis TaxID=993086 RepID=A0ABP8A716_9MICO
MTQAARTAASAQVSADSADDEPLPRRGLIFAIVSMGLFMVSVDGTVVATALTSLQRELHAGVQWGAWTITIYSLGQVLVMPLAGRISDMYGRKRVFLAAIVLFTLTSLLCGLAQNIQMLVALRAVQALGGGSIMPAASGIVSDHFGRNRDRALGMFTSIFPIGGVVGPILGGVFVTYWSWRGIFLVNVPIGMALLILGAIFFPAAVGHRGGRLDLVGSATMAATILSAMIGIAVLGDGSAWYSPGVLVPELLAVAFGWLFVRHTRRAPHPFISLHLLIGRGFGVMNVINFLYGAAAIGFGALVPLYAQERFGIPALESGTLLTARAIGMICVAGLAVAALRRTGYRFPMIVGFLLVSAGLVMMFLPPSGTSAYLWLSIAAAVTGLGMGLAVPAANNATLQFAKGQIAGVSGLRGMFRQAGSIIAVSVVTAVIAQSSTPGFSLGVSFLVLAATLIAVIPAVFLVPEHRGAW